MNKPQKYTTNNNRNIYCFQAEVFGTLIANIYLIESGERLILVDTGSGMGRSNDDLVAGITAVSETYNLPITLADVTDILITHGHIDHFGGLPFVRQHTNAPIGIHILDRRVVTNHEERRVFARSRLAAFLRNAGTAPALQETLLANYMFSKRFYRSLPTQFLLEEGVPTVENIGVYHVPGHCPGQVCLQVDDVLLTADHVLARTTPHQAPESITNNMGLGHYLDSLTKIAQLDGIRLGLGGHEAPIEDVNGRIGEIKASHDRRLGKIIAICTTPKSIADISRELFGKVNSYHILLALEEAGAHVEYLHQRGELMAANIDEIEQEVHSVVRYVRA
ncbi:MAG: MBL fold metallo-hydrolase [Chloroflexota bacterium]